MSGDEFGRAVAKIVVAELCEAVGFHGIQRFAVETLADIALRYLCDLAKAAHFYTNLAGRTECNAIDVIMALEDIGTDSSPGTDTARPLSGLRVLQEVMRYVEYSEEIPFSRPLPHFPVAKKRAIPSSFEQLGEIPPFPHIPAWLPAFPDPHTYKCTPLWDERKSDPRIDKLELARQRRKAERSLVSLHLRLSSGEKDTGPAVKSIVSEYFSGASSSLVPLSPPVISRQHWPPPSGEQEALLSKLESEGKGKGKRVTAISQNPFLVSPLAAGEIEVSSVIFPGQRADSSIQFRGAEGKIALPSVLETFAPTLETSQQELDHILDAGAGSVIPEAKDRGPIFMSFDWGRNAHKKAFVAQLSVRARHRSPAKDTDKGMAPGKEEEKDDRKKRAEQILAQSYLEGSADVTQA